MKYAKKSACIAQILPDSTTIAPVLGVSEMGTLSLHHTAFLWATVLLGLTKISLSPVPRTGAELMFVGAAEIHMNTSMLRSEDFGTPRAPPHVPCSCCCVTKFLVVGSAPENSSFDAAPGRSTLDQLPDTIRQKKRSFRPSVPALQSAQHSEPAPQRREVFTSLTSGQTLTQPLAFRRCFNSSAASGNLQNTAEFFRYTRHFSKMPASICRVHQEDNGTGNWEVVLRSLEFC